MAQIMKNAAIVYRTGGDYCLEYVERIVKSIRENCSYPLNIVCFSNDPSVANIVDSWIELDDLPGWWSKLNMFSHLDSAVYFDLDTVIRGNIDRLFEYNHTFTMLSDLLKPQYAASGILAWNGDYSYLHSLWDMSFEPQYKFTGKWGDQGWISDSIHVTPERFQNLFPGMIASYKVGYTSEPIICFHGKPRPKSIGWKV